MIHTDRVIDVLYEDDSCAVFNKPAGLLVVPTPKKEKNTLIDLVNGPKYRSEGSPRFFPCHRLDRETSGVILFAKGADHQKRLMEQFKTGRVKKKYVAFVQGKVRQKAGEIKSYIKDLDQKKYQRQAPAKWALTRYKTLQVYKRFTVLEVIPVTGRTNQIRIHFSEMGHPLVGERKYAFGRDHTVRFRRTALHALELSWYHPVGNELKTARAPWPQDMAEFVSHKDI